MRMYEEMTSETQDMNSNSEYDQFYYIQYITCTYENMQQFILND